MALPARQQVIYWGVAAAAFLVVLWYLGEVLLPFIVGGAIAYILDPLADRLERLGLPRVLATAVITLVGVLALILAIWLVIPTLVRQATRTDPRGAGLLRRLPRLAGGRASPT